MARDYERTNPKLGEIACFEGCGCNADIFQRKGKASLLYTDCAECGLNQSTAKKRQQRIWGGANWLPDAVVKRPSCVVEGEQRKPVTIDNESGDVIDKQVTESQQADLSGGWEDNETEDEPEPAEQKSGWGKAAALGVIGLAMVGGAMWN